MYLLFTVLKIFYIIKIKNCKVCSKKNTNNEHIKQKSRKRTKNEIQSYKKDVETDNHQISIEELLNRLGTDLNSV